MSKDYNYNPATSYPAKLSLEERIKAFNNLPAASSMGINHWVFGWCHIEAFRGQDVVIAVHLTSEVLKQSDPVQILTIPTAEAKADAIVGHLIHSFLKYNDDPDEAIKLRPTTWSTVHNDLVEPLRASLARHGVVPELCSLEPATFQEREVLESVRETLTGTVASMLQPLAQRPVVRLGDKTRCHGCRLMKECFFKPLSGCGKCLKAFYHSRGCQKRHWAEHKLVCAQAASGGEDIGEAAPQGQSS